MNNFGKNGKDMGYKTARLWVKSQRGGTGSRSGHDPRLCKVLDPCVGTGRMLLHASNYSYLLYGCDIDPLVAMIIMWNIRKSQWAPHNEGA